MVATTLSIFAFCLILERIFCGWKLPTVKTWHLRVIIINVIQLGVVTLAGLSWEKWLSSFSLFHLSLYVNPWPGGFINRFRSYFFKNN